LSTCLNYLARNLQRLGRLDDVEVIIVDWDSEVPLHQVMPLTQAAAKITRFIIVPPEVAHSFAFDSTFPSPFVTNIGLRRARGEFIVNIEADTCFVPSSVAALFDILEGRILLGSLVQEAYCVFSRRQVPVSRSLRKPTVEELDQYLSRARVLLPMDPMFPGMSGGGGGVLMHRSLWHAAQGLDETCIYRGWNDCDLHLRMTQNRPWVDLANFGVEVIHLEHFSGKISRATGHARKTNPHKIPQGPIHETQRNWGLAGRELPEARAAHIVPDNVLHAPAHVPGAREAWDITLPELLQQVDSEDALKIREKVVNHYNSLGLWSDIANGKPLDQLPEIQLGCYPAFEADAVAWLAWYAHCHHPRNYVEIGIRWGFSAGVVAVGCPGMEIYGIDSWQPDRRPQPTPWICTRVLLTCTGFGNSTQSYAHFVTGDPRTAVRRLFSGTSAPAYVDLAYVRTDPAYGDATENAVQIADHLAPGGMMFVLGARPSELEPVLQTLRQRYPDYSYISVNFGLGVVVLAAALNTLSR
jgi:hypothetical protein